MNPQERARRLNWRRAGTLFGGAFSRTLGSNAFGYAMGLASPYYDIWTSPLSLSTKLSYTGLLNASLWGGIRRSPWRSLGALTGTAATFGALAVGGSMAVGGAYDMVTGRRRSRLAGFTSLAMGAAIAGLPFYAPTLYRGARRLLGR